MSTTTQTIAPVHFEIESTYRLQCWCDLGHDHTLAEFMEAC